VLKIRGHDSELAEGLKVLSEIEGLLAPSGVEGEFFGFGINF